MSSIIDAIQSAYPRANFQFALLDATIRSQDILGEKQSTDSQAGIIANDLLTAEYEQATAVLQTDTDNVQADPEDQALLTIYQNDSAVCQTGESNANTSVQQEQTQVSQDGTNLSNLVSLSTTLIQIGGYVAGLIGHAY